jgi:tungstate transport system ATP-binding protein
MENILAGLVLKQDDGLIDVDVGGNIIQGMAGNAVGDKVSVLVRPEDVTLSLAKETTSARNALQGNISRVTSVGPLVRIELDCGFPLIGLVTRRSAQELGLTPGKRVYASFKATAIHIIKRLN